MHYDYSCCLPPPAVERMAAAPRLDAGPGRLERSRDCPGAGRDAGGSEPVAQAGARRRRPSLGPSHASRLGAAPVGRATGPVADAPELTRIWRGVSPRACEPPAPADRVECPEA